MQYKGYYLGQRAPATGCKVVPKSRASSMREGLLETGNNGNPWMSITSLRIQNMQVAMCGTGDPHAFGESGFRWNLGNG